MEDSTGQKSPKRLKPSISSGILIDWISDLPDSIVQHILSFLPVKDAIKFCTLSRQWDLLWTSIRNLLFYCESGKRDELDRFASFVDKTLRRYTSSKINKFLLAFRYEYLPRERVESWICFAKSRNVEELCVDFKNSGTYMTQVGKMAIKTLKLVDVSSLLEATVDFSVDYSTSSVEKDLARHKRMQKSLLYKLRHVKKFTVGTRSLQVLSIRKVDCAPFGRSGRKILKVNLNLNEAYIPGIAALLKSSPDLEQLTINIMPTNDSEFKLAGFSEKDHFIEANYWRAEMSTVKYLFQNLKSIDIVGFVAGSSSTLDKVMVELVEFLLAKAKVLQKLIIHAGPTYSPNKSWTSQQFLCCQRASPNAMVVFKNHLN